MPMRNNCKIIQPMSSTIHTKIDVAISQLDSAIQAYKNGDYIAAITLAGASEEILGAYCKRKGLETALDKIIELPVMKKYDNRKKLLNSPRNCLKHANHSNEDEFEIAEEDDYVMIVRAIANLKSLEITPSILVKDFDSMQHM